MSGKWLWPGVALLIAAMPAGNDFKLNSYGFGTGGVDVSSSQNYKMNGVAGEVAGSQSSTNYRAGAGEAYEKQAHVPTVSLTNSNNWYNKLRLTIGPQNNPGDALFAVAISTDGFATTEYVQSDFTVGPTLDFNDYQTYSTWGASSGVFVRGLKHGTVYSVRAKAWRGQFTESAFGSTASATTADPQLSFDLDVSATDASTSPPYLINFGDLLAGAVTDAPQRVWVSLETNGESGGKVYVSGQNSGLRSSASAYTIASQTGNLSSMSEGFGAQGTSATQTSGGPLLLAAPYNVGGSLVGITDAAMREIFSSSVPVVGGRGSFLLKAKARSLTPASGDYAELMTAVASASF